MTATALIYTAAGQPPINLYGDPAAPRGGGICRLCGRRVEDGIAWDRWVKDTFTDHDLLHPGSIICPACLFCVDDHSTVLQARTGRDKPQRMRNYSHLVTRGGDWYPLGKDQKRRIAQWLQEWPALVAISTAGQKHVLLRAHPGQWQIEERRCWPDPVRLARLLAAIESLYAEPRVTKGMIETSAYTMAAILALGPDRWQTTESQLRPARGSVLFALAVWLAQREEADDTDARCGRGDPDADLARDSTRLQDAVQLHDLDTVRGSRAERGVHQHAPEVSQPDLFAAPSTPSRRGTR